MLVTGVAASGHTPFLLTLLPHTDNATIIVVNSEAEAHRLATILPLHNPGQIHSTGRGESFTRHIRRDLRRSARSRINQQRAMPALTDDFRHVSVFRSLGVKRAEYCDGGHK
jgi:hypothetical protein